MVLSTHGMIPEYRRRSQFRANLECGSVLPLFFHLISILRGARNCTPKNSRFRDRMPPSWTNNSNGEMQTMMNHRKNIGKTLAAAALLVLLAFGAVGTVAQQAVPRDPAEPAQGKPHTKILTRSAGRIARASVDEKSMRALIGKLVACG